MKIEDQVVSLELAKRLKELGVKQDSLYDWVDLPGGFKLLPRKKPWIGEAYPAYTVAELAPYVTERDDNLVKPDAPFLKKYMQENGQFHIRLLYKPDFLAETVIYLIENNLITV